MSTVPFINYFCPCRRLTRYPDEKIYELARKLTIAELQSITLLDLLPMILGRTPEFMKQYTKYNPVSSTFRYPSLDPIGTIAF